ncbi:MAG: hypothetical protein LRY51_13095 [Geovibrio sp.]|nr:hypothetical protein [Geovibrio sp.]
MPMSSSADDLIKSELLREFKEISPLRDINPQSPESPMVLALLTCPESPPEILRHAFRELPAETAFAAFRFPPAASVIAPE